MPLFQILITVVLVALLTRFIRQSPVLEKPRLFLSARSALLGKLLSCPHCVSFWLALFSALLLARTLLDFGLMVILGWRGAYYLNRLLDRLARPAEARPEATEHYCYGCGAPYHKDFLERQHLFFCSHQCWFDFLKTRQKSIRHLIDKNGEPIRQDLYPLSYANITSSQAHELLHTGEDYTYIDVRSVPEFEEGHPAGSINIPLLHREPLEMVPNPDFLAVVNTNFPREARLIIGGLSGNRSRRAAEALIAAGFTNVIHVDGGFAGTRNLLGQEVEKGWLELGLPVETGTGEGQSYVSFGGRT